MKQIIVFLALAMVMVLALPPCVAQSLFINDSKDEITLTLLGSAPINLLPGDSVDLGNNEGRIAWVTRLVSHKDVSFLHRDPLFYLRPGQVKDSEVKPLLAVITNHNEREIMVEYGRYHVFVPPGATRLLPEIDLQLDMLSNAIISFRFLDQPADPPEKRILNFQFKEDRLQAAFNL